MSYAEEMSAQSSEPFGDDMEALLAARATVEQAKGILMERYAISADAAFAVLRRHSQHTNRKLRSIAEDLLSTGRLPDERGHADTPPGHPADQVRPPPLGCLTPAA